MDKNIRGLAWVAVKWAKAVRPRVIMLENVEEFKSWGPLKNGYPDPGRKGETFELFIGALKRLGYKVDFRELRACDYGAPTTRRRFFMIARCDGKPIAWPEPTHGDPKQLEVVSGLLKPWRAAAECIDWSLPCPSIFERKRPLVENTMRRIARGIQKFVIDNPQPFIIKVDQGIATPFLTQYHSYDHEPRGQVIDKPVLTIDTSNRYGLVAAFIQKFYKTGTGQTPAEPLHTITTSTGHFAEVRAFLMSYYGNSSDTGQRLDEPLRTITSKDRFGIITVHGQDYQIVDIGMRMLTPKEMFKAQGFPDNYIIDRDYTGKVYPKTAQVRNVGNSVSPVLPEAMVRANLPELCEENFKEVI